MARYLSRPYVRRIGRGRRWMYIIPVPIIIAVVIAFIYGSRPSGKSKDKTPSTLADVHVENEIVPPEPEPTLPEITPVPEPTLPEIAPVPTSEPNTNVAALIAAASAHIDARPARTIEARDRLNEALPMPMSSQQRDVVMPAIEATIKAVKRSIFAIHGL